MQLVHSLRSNNPLSHNTVVNVIYCSLGKGGRTGGDEEEGSCGTSVDAASSAMTGTRGGERSADGGGGGVEDEEEDEEEDVGDDVVADLFIPLSPNATHEEKHHVNNSPGIFLISLFRFL